MVTPAVAGAPQTLVVDASGYGAPPGRTPQGGEGTAVAGPPSAPPFPNQPQGMASSGEPLKPEDPGYYCEVCPHAMFLHDSAGDCGCGVHCSAEREQAAKLKQGEVVLLQNGVRVVADPRVPEGQMLAGEPAAVEAYLAGRGKFDMPLPRMGPGTDYWYQGQQRVTSLHDGPRTCLQPGCGGWIGPDVTDRPACYRCGTEEMRRPELARMLIDGRMPKSREEFDEHVRRVRISVAGPDSEETEELPPLSALNPPGPDGKPVAPKVKWGRELSVEQRRGPNYRLAISRDDSGDNYTLFEMVREGGKWRDRVLISGEGYDVTERHMLDRCVEFMSP